MVDSTKWITYVKDKENDPIYRSVLFALLFFICTAYLFVGIAIASDIFMSAIEKICGATRTVKETKEEDGVVTTTTREILIWNDTVANLTLMALGSSAPEILLSVIEISEGLGKQLPGDLGPGTIVGSAAFNLMIISALCILCLKDGQTSRIKLYNVFAITCFSSLFAYIWMVVVLQWWTPDIVTIPEALLTLLYCPLLVAISYWADQDFCVTGRPEKRKTITSADLGEERGFYFADKDEDNLYDEEGNLDKQALQNLYNKLTEVAILTPEEVATILATKMIQTKHHSRNWYRTKAAKALVGGGSGLPQLNEKLQEVVDVIGEYEAVSNKPSALSSNILKSTITSPDTYTKKAVVEFQAAALAVSEAVGNFQVVLIRKGREDLGFKIQVDSVDGTAKGGVQYETVSTTVQFDPYVKEQVLNVNVIDNSEWNPDSTFYLKLTIPQEFSEKVAAGQMRVIQIIIEDDDKPGRLSFVKRGYLFQDQKTGCLDVQRTDGTDGTITVKWKTIPGPNCKLIPADLEGKISFGPGELKKPIELHFLPHDGKVEGSDEVFEVELFEPQGGAKLGKVFRVTCAITSDQKFKLEINDVMTAAIQQVEESEETVSYKDQITQALYPNDGDYVNATVKQWVLHIAVFPFKFLLSLIPPPHIAGGWLCFILALGSIGLLTKLVGETAGSFGDAAGLDPVVTAITFVALGTSLPDTFASMIAARSDKTADNAIGNVTGSNSVNVFLGLGLPWVVGAFYYRFQHKGPQGNREEFCVPAGSLTFNVLVFSICAFITIAILIFRRYSPICGCAELGGPTVPKWITAMSMILMWFLYIGLSSTEAYIPKISEPFRGGNEKTQCARIVKLAQDKLKGKG